MDTWERFSLALEEAKQAKKLDPVGQEDADIDNDGDVDSSDKYLKNRRDSIGARIAADKKKKVEEALDPVGKEDEDIDNDGDSDKTDKYLLNRRKVRSKIIQSKVKEECGCEDSEENEDKKVKEIDVRELKTKINLAKNKMRAMGLKMSHELEGELISEFDIVNTVGPVIDRAVNTVFGEPKPKKPISKPISPVAKQKPPTTSKPTMGQIGSQIRSNIDTRNQQTQQAINKMRGLSNSYEQEGSLVEGKKKDDSYLETDMKKRRENNEKAIEDMKKTKGYSDMVKSARKAMGVDEEFVGENKEHRLEMAKAAARERAEERREKGGKSAKSPGREGPSAGKSYADYQEISIKAHDKITKKNKNVPGLVTKEETDLQEKALSRAQQRFMGMVYAAKKGETPASPEVAKAAEGMSKKSAKDFAKTKHAGLPEKKVSKEETFLVNKIIAEASEAQIMAAKARREEREKKQSSRMKQSKLSVAANQAMQDESERKGKAKEEVKSKRGKSALTGAERAEAIRTAGKVKTAKILQQTEREKQKSREEREKQSALKEKEQQRKEAEETKKQKQQSRRSELRQDIKAAWSGGTKVAGDKKDTEAVSAGMSNLGSLVGGVAKTGIALGKYALKKRQERKEAEKQKQESKVEDQKEQFYNWREEFISEVDDQTVKNQKQKVIDVSKKKNKIEINPNISEENVQEFAALVPLVARLVGGVASRGVASRIAGGAAQGSLRSKAAELVGQKAGDIASQSIENRMKKKPEEPQEDEYYMTNLERKLRKEDWQSVNRKDKTAGLSQKAVDAYRRENPGSKLQTAVTEKKPEGKRAERRKSFCRRMSGMKKKLTSAETARDPDSRINKALRRWNCN